MCIIYIYFSFLRGRTRPLIIKTIMDPLRLARHLKLIIIHFASSLVDLSHSLHIQLRATIKGIETIDFLFNVGPIQTVSLVLIMREWKVNLQLGVDKSTAQSTLHNPHNQILIPFQQVLWITRGNVAPIFLSSGFLTLCWRDIDTAKFSADDWCSWRVFTSGVSRNIIDEDIVVAFLVDNSIDRGASFGQCRCFCVVVEGGKIRNDMLPAAIIINASSRIQSSAIDQSGLVEQAICHTYFVM